MHGLILAELKKYVDTKLGKDAWNGLLAAAGLSHRVYLTGVPYPDEEVMALVTTASKTTGLPAADILEDFGEFIVPDLVQTYRPFIKPGWKALDMIEHTEETIHRAVRLRDRGAKPPQLKVTRVDARSLQLVYTSPRKLCAVAKGIAKGVGAFYKQPLTLTETTCMLRGDAVCAITIGYA